MQLGPRLLSVEVDMFGSRFINVRKNLSVAFNALYAIFASVFMLLWCRMSNFKDSRNLMLFYCIF
jgi:hypothetical protein